MFRGITAITMDAKGRLAIPTRYREELTSSGNGSLVVTIDTEENCLLLYPISQWHHIEAKVQSLPSFNAYARRLQRLLIGHATDVELDSTGRLLLSPVLRKYACLDKQVVMIGQGNKFEIWDETMWEEKRNSWLAEEAAQLLDIPDEMKSFSL